MRKEKVPVDMSSEQRELLGLVSKREMAYLVIGGLLLYSYIPLVFNLFSGFGYLLAAILCVVSAMPVAFIVLFFGFVKEKRFNMNRDYYYWIKLQRRTQYGSWRKGS